MSGSAVPRAGTSTRIDRAAGRRFPIGVECMSERSAAVRVWAPAAQTVTIVCGGGATAPEETALESEGGGYFSAVIRGAAGDLYRFRLDNDARLYPDPASRFQPEGPHGPSEIVDATRFAWSDAAWRGLTLEGQVLYELHIGTFTSEGTWAAAERQLPELAHLGITSIEIMPVAEFDGRFGWGYDGVDLFAPTRLYGRPDDFRRFVDSAHRLGLGVILDVVYNHLGPSGNYLRAFAPSYFSDRHESEWGDAINYESSDSAPVREFFVTNAAYWIDEFHVDGLRLDATQQIFDESPEHVVAAIGRRAREAAGGRRILLIAENERQDTRLVRPIVDGGHGLDAVWNDDWHHSATAALTGRAEAYYSDTCGSAQEFVSAAKYGYLFQGQHYAWQQQRRGGASWGLAPTSFVVYLQNHDQVANSARGLRGHRLTSPGRWRAMTAVLLLSPSTPMLFQGQEFAASARFLYFADHGPELARAVRTGRAEFLRQFPSVVDFEAQGGMDDPCSLATFNASVIDSTERHLHAEVYALHHDLLRIRREDPVVRRQGRDGLDGAVLTDRAFVLRFFSPGHTNDRLLVVNIGSDFRRRSLAEPLVAPPEGCDWTVLWSSEDPAYGGVGTPALSPNRWSIPGEIALLLGPTSCTASPSKAIRRRTA
jgi:maltooligosyltrehalose trehalohydrolase